ncbi:MAG: M28 family metallopeptidase [Pyrinomonadaceae bacterium]
MKRLEVISRQPHPVGSAEHAAVRDYIFGELSAGGLRPEVQKTTVSNVRWGDDFRAGTVENVVARLAGSEGGKAILLAAHYDSAPASYGASDDGSGVAALLETARVLTAGERLKNDVIFLFTDGEEAGLLGAHAFVNEHPWAKDVGLVLNFEARGSGGPAIMFETSEGNGWLVEEFAKAAPRPVANSLTYDIYKLLPNDTDFTVFRNAGLQGFNFAYIDGFEHYHTRLDNVRNIDEDSLQHHGAYALALTRHFGGLRLDGRREPNAVYFDLLGLRLIHYSGVWALALSGLVALVFAGVVVYGLRRRRLTVPGIALGFLTLLLGVIAAAALVMCVGWLARAVGGRPGGGDGGRSVLYVTGLAALVVGSISALYVLLRRKTGGGNMAAGALLFLLVWLGLAHLYLPGGTYLLAWPLLFSTLGLGYALASEGEGGASWKTAVVLALCGAPAVLLLTPMIYQLFVALGSGAAVVLAVVMVLLLGLLRPQFDLLAARRTWLLAGVALLAGVILLTAAAVTSGASKDNPKSNSVFYAFNADTNKAAWVTGDGGTDEWTAQFFPSGSARGALTEYLPWGGEHYLKGRAPAAPVAAPEVVAVEDGAAGGARRLRLRITSPRRAAVMTIFVNGEVSEASVNGKAVGEVGGQSGGTPSKKWVLHYSAPPPEGIELSLTLKSAGPLEVVVVDETNGLPELPGSPYKPRPEEMMSSPFRTSDLTFVRKTFTL